MRRFEGEARRLVQRLYVLTGGRPGHWRMISDLDVAGDSQGIQYAVDEGWMLIQGGHSVCLTDEGRRLAA